MAWFIHASGWRPEILFELGLLRPSLPVTTWNSWLLASGRGKEGPNPINLQLRAILVTEGLVPPLWSILVPAGASHTQYGSAKFPLVIYTTIGHDSETWFSPINAVLHLILPVVASRCGHVCLSSEPGRGGLSMVNCAKTRRIVW